jgi:hypothetical protein
MAALDLGRIARQVGRAVRSWDHHLELPDDPGHRRSDRSKAGTTPIHDATRVDHQTVSSPRPMMPVRSSSSAELRSLVGLFSVPAPRRRVAATWQRLIMPQPTTRGSPEHERR